MRTFRVVTSQHRPYYDLIGKDCIKTFLEFWPKEISIELWAEGFVPDIEDPRLIVKDYNKVVEELSSGHEESVIDLANGRSVLEAYLKRKGFVTLYQQSNNSLHVSF